MGALRRAGEPAFVQARHEEAAAFMAVGHAKYTGRVGVVLSTQGPGAVHLLNGLYDAKLDSQPVVALMGQQDRPASAPSTFQRSDWHRGSPMWPRRFGTQRPPPGQGPLGPAPPFP